ncbi:isoprenoid biosynthesis glyoxalase ElbB [Gibbsiella dentisursi]|uniref:Glyoxalase n=1 Tax=Gibbsiella dentisursi TaxID=796890 RepID=A0ABP7LI44_9GAMM
MKQVGVVLSGCGVYDGSEIHEAVLTLLALDRAGVQAVCFAPDKPQHVVINHVSGDAMPEVRNVLVESARIARGKIQPLAQADAAFLDALIIPGGFGAANNLSTFASAAEECHIDPDLAKLVQKMHKLNKPIGLICIAPVLLPKLLDRPVRLTIGNDPDLGEVIDAMGGVPVTCPVGDIVIDNENNVVTTPAYMLAQSIGEVAQGVDKLVARIVELANA